ncbi:MAG: hypothetical protein JWO80_3798, partial [Bryobacterales bacterium]|nr:hypothetical protein [Bryobacterales bacterium]
MRRRLVITIAIASFGLLAVAPTVPAIRFRD